MSQNSLAKFARQHAANIIRDAGGKIIGRTKLQKIGYLLEITGLGEKFEFEYHHYGPYSEELARGIELAGIFDLVKEEVVSTDWGFYSVFTSDANPDDCNNEARKSLAKKAADANSIELELAATAAYLARDGYDDPWEETKIRKPEKSEGRIEKAKELYKQLQQTDTPNPLPIIL